MQGIDYIGLGLENGYIKLIWSLHCNGTFEKARDFPTPPQLISSLVQAGFMADGEWHSIELSMENYIIFAVDNKTFVEEQCYNEFEYEDIDLFIGKCCFYDYFLCISDINTFFIFYFYSHYTFKYTSVVS